MFRCVWLHDSAQNTCDLSTVFCPSTHSQFSLFFFCCCCFFIVCSSVDFLFYISFCGLQAFACLAYRISVWREELHCTVYALFFFSRYTVFRYSNIDACFCDPTSNGVRRKSRAEIVECIKRAEQSHSIFLFDRVLSLFGDKKYLAQNFLSKFPRFHYYHE